MSHTWLPYNTLPPSDNSPVVLSISFRISYQFSRRRGKLRGDEVNRLHSSRPESRFATLHCPREGSTDCQSSHNRFGNDSDDLLQLQHLLQAQHPRHDRQLWHRRHLCPALSSHIILMGRLGPRGPYARQQYFHPVYFRLGHQCDRFAASGRPLRPATARWQRSHHHFGR